MVSVCHYLIGMFVIAALASADHKMHGMAPQGTQLQIECESGNITSIISATYGSQNCTVKDVSEKVQQLCLGLPICSIRVDDATLGGDNCPGEHKDLIVETVCSKKPQMISGKQPQKGSSSSAQPQKGSESGSTANRLSGPEAQSIARSPASNASQPQPQNAAGSPALNAVGLPTPTVPESLSLGMLQRLVALNRLSECDNIEEIFNSCDRDKDGRISAREIDNLIGRLQKDRNAIRNYPETENGNVDLNRNSASSNSSTAGNQQADRLNQLIATLENLSDEIKALLNGNATLPVVRGNATDVEGRKALMIGNATLTAKGNTTDDERRKLDFKNMMSPSPAPTTSPTTLIPLTPMPWKKWGSTPTPKNISSIEHTIDVQFSNGTGFGNSSDPFSTRSVVYIPTGQSRKLLCSGLITDVWFSTYWWPDSPASEHIRDEPECKQEQAVALETLKQMCLQKPDCTVTAPASTLSEKCPLSLKYVTVAYKCTLPAV